MPYPYRPLYVPASVPKPKPPKTLPYPIGINEAPKYPIKRKNSMDINRLVKNLDLWLGTGVIAEDVVDIDSIRVTVFIQSGQHSSFLINPLVEIGLGRDLGRLIDYMYEKLDQTQDDIWDQLWETKVVSGEVLTNE